MRLDAYNCYFNLITHEHDVWKHKLFHELSWCYLHAYNIPKSDVTFRYLTTCLPHMAQWLRQEHDWKVYHWRESTGMSDVQDHNSYMHYGRREGLIFGAYCGNLTAWLLTNT